MAQKNERKVAIPVPAVLLAGLGTSIAGVYAGSKVAEQLLQDQVHVLDKRLTHITHEARSPAIERIMRIASGAGEPWTLYPLTGLLAARWTATKYGADGLTLGLALVGSAAINEALKHAVRRPRPLFRLPLPRVGSSGSSFPSNHATMSLATYGAIAYLVARRKGTRRRAAALLWALVLLLCIAIGWSRIYLGVHNASDVLGGAVAGTIWLLTCGAARGMMELRQQEASPEHDIGAAALEAA